MYIDRNEAGNGAINSITVEDVDSIVLKLGKDRPNTTGDGVDFRLFATVDEVDDRLPVKEDKLRDIPEPSVVLGLGAVAAMSGLGLRKRQSSK